MGTISGRKLSIEQLESRRLLAFNPTAHEQEMLQLINRFRTDPRGEFNRMFSSASPLRSRDPSLQAELDLNQVNGNMLRNEWNALNPAEPLIWNEALYQFASSHNAQMISQNRAFHSNSTTRQNAIRAAGIQFRAEAELVSFRASNPIQGYAVYAVNWGTNANTGKSKGGMQDPRGHRGILINPAYDQIGHRVTSTNASFLKPSVNTAVVVDTLDAPVVVTGAVFEDKNKNGWYESGEGRGNVQLRFEKTTGDVFTTKTLGAGGYQIALLPGVYKVRATGGGLKHAVVQTITLGNSSLWRNFIYDPSGPAPDAQEPNDNRTTATRLTGRSPELSGLSLHTNSDSDFFRFVSQGTDLAKYQVEFTHSSGNIDIELQDSTGKVLAKSAGTGNKETIVHQAEAGKVYFLRVYGKANPNYSLKIEGPEAIQPDASEPNDSLQSATVLTGANPSLNNRSLHSNLDVDYFKVVAIGNGPAEFEVQFQHAQGNIDLQLLNANGNVLATSASNGNVERISRNVARDQVYFLRVFGGPNRNYSLKVTLPELRPPVARDDQSSASSDSPLVQIPILNNDSDPDGNLATLVPMLAVGTSPAFRLKADGSAEYQAPPGFTGMHRANYTVTNQDGLTSQPATIEVFVVDFGRNAPWQHPNRPNDVNDDGRSTAVDALMVINELNSSRPRNLPIKGKPAIRGFVDTNGDGRVTASDALRVINELNLRSSGEGESRNGDTFSGFGGWLTASQPSQHDLALEQMMLSAWPLSPIAWPDQSEERRRS
jgi:uncharacterized protein YkwD